MGRSRRWVTSVRWRAEAWRAGVCGAAPASASAAAGRIAGNGQHAGQPAGSGFHPHGARSSPSRPRCGCQRAMAVAIAQELRRCTACVLCLRSPANSKGIMHPSGDCVCCCCLSHASPGADAIEGARDVAGRVPCDRVHGANGPGDRRALGHPGPGGHRQLHAWQGHGRRDGCAPGLPPCARACAEAHAGRSRSRRCTRVSAIHPS